MKIRVNGKKLKDAIDIALIKGKWCNGTSATNSSLGNVIVIEAGDECYIYNANESTYIKRKVTPIEVEETGRACVDTSVLVKYLQNETCEIETTETNLEIRTNSKTITIPLTERHPYNDSILFIGNNLNVDIDTMELDDYKEGVRISPKTVLNTIVLVDSDTLKDSIKNCELVGSAIYKLDYADNNLSVSSQLENQNMNINIEVEGTENPAIMEFTAPLQKVLTDDNVILAFNDDSPLCIVSTNTIMLRAPRQGVD